MTDRGWNGPKWSDEPSDASSNRAADSPGEAKARCSWCDPAGYDYCGPPCPNLAREMALGHSIPNRVERDPLTGLALEFVPAEGKPIPGGIGPATRNRVDTMSADWKDGYETGYAEGWLAASKGEPGPWT